ncbi:MAG: YCF48-related protein, partial [Ignavibacteriaceae bacterium]
MKVRFYIISIFTLFLVFLNSNAQAQWERVPVGNKNNFKDLFFINSETGWVVGGGATILKTLDGGETWIAQQPNVSQNITSVFFLDGDLGWAASRKG